MKAPPTAQAQAAHAVRKLAAVGFWLMTVLFVANIGVLNGWLALDRAAAAPDDAPAAAPTPEPTESESGPVAVAVSGATVVFPDPPHRSSTLLDVAGAEASLTLYSATVEEETTYNLGVIDYPDSVDLSDPAVNLLASVSGAAGSAGGRIIEQDVTLFEGHPAVTFRIETPAVRLAGRHVLVDRRMYTQNVAYRGVNDPPGAKDFFDSLRLTGDSP